MLVVRCWVSEMKFGDMGEFKLLFEDVKVLLFVIFIVDNCLGRDCFDYEECYLVKVRCKVLDVDIIVVNYYLFFVDMVLKDIGFGELIFEVDVIIFDEVY